MGGGAFAASAARLADLDRLVREHAADLAVWLVYDRPSRVLDRPGLAAAYFAERCVSDRQLQLMMEALRDVGAYVELLGGDLPFLEAITSGRIEAVGRRWNVAYNGLESGISPGGFQPGRRALVPAVADAYGYMCANSNGYGCVLARHKLHYFAILDDLGFPVPRTWGYRTGRGWTAGRTPEPGTTVIVKSTYESWSIGVTEGSVFAIDGPDDERVSAIAEQIGQPVTVQEFVPGTEVCVPVLVERQTLALPPVLSVLAKAPDDPEAFMTIDDNLRPDGVEYRPLDDDDAIAAAVSLVARRTCEVLDLDGLARIDFRVDPDGTPYITDVGAAPGLSAAGSTVASARSLGIGHEALVRGVVGATLVHHGVVP